MQKLNFQAKYLQQSKEIKLNWTGLANFDIYLACFWLLLPKVNFWKLDWILDYIPTQI